MAGESEADRKQTIRRFVEAVWGDLTTEAFGAVLDPEFVGHETGNPRALDRSSLERQTRSYREAFHGLQAHVENPILENGHGACLWWAEGTHRGRFQGVEPTGRRVLVTGMALLRFRHGKVVESWLTWDRLGLMQQIGAAPQVPSAPAGR